MEAKGIATAANMFMRNLGNTIGAALLGGILNSQIKLYIQKNGEGIDESLSLDSANVLLNEEARNSLNTGVKELLQNGLTVSLHSVYYAVLLFAVISFLLVIALPKHEKEIAD